MGRLERLKAALEYRKLGLTYGQIASKMNVSEPTAFRWVNEELERLKFGYRESFESVRQLELERLDAVQIKVFQEARQGSHGAVDRLLKIMERRAKLLGVDLAIDGSPPSVTLIIEAYLTAMRPWFDRKCFSDEEIRQLGKDLNESFRRQSKLRV